MRSLTACSLALLVVAPAVAKDLVLHQRFSPSSGAGETFDMVEYLTPSLRIVDGPHSRTIIDATARNVTVLDKDAKTYWQVSWESLRRQTEPLDQRRGKALEPDVGTAVTLGPTGSTETIAGHPCEQHILQGGSPAGSVCVAKDIEPPTDPALWKDWTGLGTRLGPSFKVLDALGPTRVALRTVVKIGASGGPSVTTLVTSLGDESPPADLTAIPSDYTRATRHSQQR